MIRGVDGFGSKLLYVSMLALLGIGGCGNVGVSQNDSPSSTTPPGESGGAMAPTPAMAMPRVPSAAIATRKIELAVRNEGMANILGQQGNGYARSWQLLACLSTGNKRHEVLLVCVVSRQKQSEIGRVRGHRWSAAPTL